MMRNFIPLSILVLAAALAAAQVKTPEQKTATRPPAGEGQELSAVVLATDTTARTITVKKDTDSLTAGAETERTLAVDAKASASLGGVMIGDKVRLVLKTDPSGKDLVTQIEKAAAPARD